MSSIKSGLADAGPVRLFYEWRAGPASIPVVLLPGAGADHMAVAPQARFFEAKGYPVLSFDPRGTGRSSRPKNAYSTQEMAEDVVHALDDLSVDRFYLFGHSLGSAVAQHVALAAGGRVAGLLLAASWYERDAYLSLQFLATQTLVRQNPPDVYGRALLYLIASRAHINATGKQLGGMVEAMYSGRRAAPAEVLLQHLGAGEGHNMAGRIGEIAAPCLVMAGERDMMVPAEYGEALSKALPGAQFHLFTGPRASHLFHYELQGEVNETMLSFLEGLEP